MGAMPERLWNSNFILVFLSNLFMMMAFYVLMPILPIYLVNNLGYDKALVGIMMSIYIIFAVLSRPFSGFLIDALNRKKFFVVVLFLFMTTFWGYIVFVSFALLFIVRIVQGCIWGIVIPLANTLAIDVVPSSRRGAGIGYFGMSCNLAMALGPLVGLTCLHYMGFYPIVFVSMAMTLCGFLLALCIKTKVKPNVSIKNQPISLDRFILLPAIPVGITILLACFSYGVIVNYAALYGLEIGTNEAGLFFLLFAGGIVLSRLCMGRFVDRQQFLPLSVIALSLLSVGYLAFGLFRHVWVYFGLSLPLGFGYGMLMPALQTMSVNMGSHSQRGTATSTYFIGLDVGVGVGMLLGGIIAERFSFMQTFVVSGLLNLVGLLYFVKYAYPAYERGKVSE